MAHTTQAQVPDEPAGQRGSQIWVRKLSNDEMLLVKLLRTDERAVLLIEAGRVKLLNLVDGEHIDHDAE